MTLKSVNFLKDKIILYDVSKNMTFYEDNQSMTQWVAEWTDIDL